VSRELSSDDVKFSYERLLRDSPGKTDFAAIDGVEAVDRYRVSFTLREPNAGLLTTMASPQWGAIVNRETVEKHGDLRNRAVGTGPFVLEAWKVELETRLKRNPEYWDKGKPYLDGVILKIIPDEAAIVAGLRSGAIQHAMLEDNRNFDLLKDEKRLIVYRTPRLGYEFLSLNQKSAPFDKMQVVQAINYAIDRNALIRDTARGFGVLTAPATPPMKQWLIEPARWMSFYRVDLDRAKRLLAEAGYPNGFDLTILTIPGLPAMLGNAQAIQAQLRQVGINVRVESLDYPVWIQRWQKKEWTATVNTTNGQADPDAAFYRAFHSKAQNWNNYNNPEVDRLLDEGRAEQNFERRKSVYDRVQIQLLENPGQLYLFVADMIDVTQAGVMDFSQHPTTALWSYANVWLDA
jgi:peptide/nickel transport system substrate-binding protein